MAAAREPYNVTANTHSDVDIHPPASGWHSPIPYLFGGLASMLGLIAFALLILACSYWKLSGRHVENDGQGSGQTERDLEAGEGNLSVMEQKVLVIMAGQVKPTFLATPIASSRSSSFGEKICHCNENGDKLEVLDRGEKQVRRGGGGNDDHRETTTETQQSNSRPDH